MGRVLVYCAHGMEIEEDGALVEREDEVPLAADVKAVHELLQKWARKTGDIHFTSSLERLTWLDMQS